MTKVYNAGNSHFKFDKIYDLSSCNTGVETVLNIET